MYLSEALGELIQLIAKHGDVRLVMGKTEKWDVDVRSLYFDVSEGTVVVEPVDH